MLCDFPPLNYKTANEDSLAFTQKLNQATANFNQRVKLRKEGRGKRGKARRSQDKDTSMICVYILLNKDYFVSIHPWMNKVQNTR